MSTPSSHGFWSTLLAMFYRLSFARAPALLIQIAGGGLNDESCTSLRSSFGLASNKRCVTTISMISELLNCSCLSRAARARLKLACC
jgi:hypothetical protein